MKVPNMNTTMTKTEVLNALRELISDCIGVDVDEIDAHSRFFDDLDGESIDVIDMMFRCEKRFGVRVELQSLLSNLELAPDGTLSEGSLRELQSNRPEINWATRFQELTSRNPREILTVDLICELILVHLNQQLDARGPAVASDIQNTGIQVVTAPAPT